jgi:hypothetical protein
MLTWTIVTASQAIRRRAWIGGGEDWSDVDRPPRQSRSRRHHATQGPPFSRTLAGDVIGFDRLGISRGHRAPGASSRNVFGGVSRPARMAPCGSKLLVVARPSVRPRCWHSGSTYPWPLQTVTRPTSRRCTSSASASAAPLESRTTMGRGRSGPLMSLLGAAHR